MDNVDKKRITRRDFLKVFGLVAGAILLKLPDKQANTQLPETGEIGSSGRHSWIEDRNLIVEKGGVSKPIPLVGTHGPFGDADNPQSWSALRDIPKINCTTMFELSDTNKAMIERLGGGSWDNSSWGAGMRVDYLCREAFDLNAIEGKSDEELIKHWDTKYRSVVEEQTKKEHVWILDLDEPDPYNVKMVKLPLFLSWLKSIQTNPLPLKISIWTATDSEKIDYINNLIAIYGAENIIMGVDVYSTPGTILANTATVAVAYPDFLLWTTVPAFSDATGMNDLPSLGQITKEHVVGSIIAAVTGGANGIFFYDHPFRCDINSCGDHNLYKRNAYIDSKEPIGQALETLSKAIPFFIGHEVIKQISEQGLSFRVIMGHNGNSLAVFCVNLANEAVNQDIPISVSGNVSFSELLTDTNHTSNGSTLKLNLEPGGMAVFICDNLPKPVVPTPGVKGEDDYKGPDKRRS